MFAPLCVGCLNEQVIEAGLDRLATLGFRSAITSALPEDDADSYAVAGFEVAERLWLLARPLFDAPAKQRPRSRRARTRDRNAVLDLDRRAFEAFWQLDDQSLSDATTATPRHRYRVVDDAGIVGYSVFGLAGRTGYLQRLAVDPNRRREGIASALVNDGLRWLTNRGATCAYVNTQIGNDRARKLYESLGFALQPRGLVVMQLDLPLHTR